MRLLRWLPSLCVLLLVLPLQAQAPEELPRVEIGFVADGPYERHQAFIDLVQQEIQELVRREFDVQFPERFSLQADGTMDGVAQAVDQLLADDEVDLLVMVGVMASHYAATRDSLAKPVISPSIINAVLQGAPYEAGRSGMPNLSYLEIPNSAARDVRFFREIVPFRKIAFLVGRNYADVLSGLAEHILTLLEVDFEWEVVPVDADVETALAALPADADAVYLLPLLHLSSPAFDRLVAGLNARRLPTFSYMGERDVERGVLATLTPDFMPRMTRRVALNVQRILLGADAGSLPVAFAVGERLTINAATVRQTGISLPLEILIEAVLLHEELEEGERLLNLGTAVQEGVTSNLALISEGHFVDAGAQNIPLARSSLLPQLNIGATGLLVDKNLAEASFGVLPQRSLDGALTLNQLVFAEPARANVTIQRRLQEAREFGYDMLYQDIALDVAVSYLSVLRTKSFERIQSDNLRLTRANLELAQAREAIGQAGPGEVFRWETALAQNRQSRIDAYARRRVAELALNQTLNRPLDEPFATADVAIDDPTLALNEEVFTTYMRDLGRFDVFQEFLVQEGLKNAPELKGLEATIAAQERNMESKRKASWAPTVALQGQVNSTLAEGGAGTDGGALSNSIALPERNNTHWNLGLSVSFPLFTGFARKAQRIQAADELAQLQVKRDLVRQRIEQNIRSQAIQAGASFASIAQAEVAAAAAQRTLDLVQTAYANGLVDILDLIDAQNTVLVTQELATNAAYDFLINVMETERAISEFGFFKTPDERVDFRQRLDAFFAASGVR